MVRVSAGGAACLFGGLRKLWNGAKEVLRVAKYWQMKERAGVVGRQGLGTLIDRLRAKTPSTNVHLIGHSFGARLVSYSLFGLPVDLVGTKSPVKSLLLLQGAFSHFAFFAGTTYAFAPGKWINLDGNNVIVRGGLPSGAHSDIVHPHTAWVALAAAKLV